MSDSKTSAVKTEQGASPAVSNKRKKKDKKKGKKGDKTKTGASKWKGATLDFDDNKVFSLKNEL